MKRTILTTLILFLLQIGMTAQCFNPDVTFGTSCSTAPVLCPSGYNLSYFCGTTEFNSNPPFTNEQPAGFCGIIDNPQWFGFVAATTNISIYILVENCQGTFNGSGMQAMVYESCGNPWIPAAPCINQIYPNSNIYYTLSNLTIGQTYYLVLDGWNGDVCDFEVEVASGNWAGFGDQLIADAGDDIVINCNNNSILLDGSNSTFGTNSIFTWYDINNNFIGNGMTFSVSQTGTYILEIIDDPLICPSADTVNVSVVGVTQLELGVGAFLDCNTGMTIIEGQNVPLDPTYSYLWSTIDGNIVAGENTPTPTVDTIGTYHLLISENVGGCSFSDTINVYEFDDILTNDSPHQLDCGQVTWTTGKKYFSKPNTSSRFFPTKD